MKRYLKLLTVLVCALVATFALALGACAGGDNGGDKNTKPEKGTIHGTVLDEDGEPIEGAEVYLNDEEDDFFESDEDGAFEIKNVTVGDITLKAVYSGYEDTTKSLTEADFDTNGDATVKIVMQEGHGTVTGIVSMNGNTTAHLEGATVKIGSLTATTDANGSYEIKNVRMLGTQSVVASLAGFADGRATVTARSFSNGVARVNITLIQNDREDFPGIKPYQLETLNPLDASKTTYSSSDISANFLSAPDALSGMSKVETHGEGYCINANTTADNANMVAFVFAKINVTESNKYLTAYARVFEGQNGGDHYDEDTGAWTEKDAGHYAKLGLYAFELGTDGSYTLKTSGFGDFTEIKSAPAFMPVTFDLSSEVGKTIVFVLGTKTGYHCCLDRIEFSGVKPEYRTVTDVKGIDSLRLGDKVTEDTFDAAALKDKWSIAGATTKVDEGIQLNGTDPWKAVELNATDPQPVNSYMYIRKDLSAEKAQLKVTATIVKLADTYDSAQDNKQFLPYISVIVLDENGNKLYQSDWKQVVVTVDKTPVNFEFDLASYAGEDRTIIIASNVGYRATITNVEFAETSAPATVALLPKKKEL